MVSSAFSSCLLLKSTFSLHLELQANLLIMFKFAPSSFCSKPAFSSYQKRPTKFAFMIEFAIFSTRANTPSCKLKARFLIFLNNFSLSNLLNCLSIINNALLFCADWSSISSFHLPAFLCKLTHACAYYNVLHSSPSFKYIPPCFTVSVFLHHITCSLLNSVLLAWLYWLYMV